ncbi:MAG: hypothetical protein IPL08_05820 [Saprospiraceae bacterium]|nr:hypothetical protein [Saprospiraceae bacterium]
MDMDKYKIKQLDGKAYVDPRDIEYKLVDVEQFTSCGYDVYQTPVVQNDKGYITDDLLSKISIKDKCTDVINVATGSGKTTAIYHLVKRS